MKVFHAARSVGLKSCSPAGGSKEPSGISTPCFEFEVDATLHARNHPHSGFARLPYLQEEPIQHDRRTWKDDSFLAIVRRPTSQAKCLKTSIDQFGRFALGSWKRGRGACSYGAEAGAPCCQFGKALHPLLTERIERFVRRVNWCSGRDRGHRLSQRRACKFCRHLIRWAGSRELAEQISE